MTQQLNLCVMANTDRLLKNLVPYFKDIWMWGYNQQTLYECKIIPKVISATKKDDNLFGSSCKAKDLKCELSESIVIWKPDIVLDCPFRPVKYGIEFLVHTNDNENSNTSWALEIKNKAFHCNNKLHFTTDF